LHFWKRYKFADTGALSKLPVAWEAGIALFHGSKIAFLGRIMTLDEITGQIKNCASQMNARYGGVVFDEWAIVSLVQNKARILNYIGPRNDDFLKNFARDLGALRAELVGGQYGAGDFEFARHGIGTGFESFLVLGAGVYLICNNTHESMDSITKNPRWLEAQVPFAELADKVRAHPAAISGDTQHFKKPS
jgi:hypothetical protein